MSALQVRAAQFAMSNPYHTSYYNPTNSPPLYEMSPLHVSSSSTTAGMSMSLSLSQSQCQSHSPSLQLPPLAGMSTIQSPSLAGMNTVPSPFPASSSGRSMGMGYSYPCHVTNMTSPSPGSSQYSMYASSQPQNQALLPPMPNSYVSYPAMPMPMSMHMSMHMQPNETQPQPYQPQAFRPPTLMSGEFQKLPKKSFKRIPIDFLLNQETAKVSKETNQEILNDINTYMIIRSKDNTPRKRGSTPRTAGDYGSGNGNCNVSTPKSARAARMAASVANTAAIETTAAKALATTSLQAVTDSNVPSRLPGRTSVAIPHRDSQNIPWQTCQPVVGSKLAEATGVAASSSSGALHSPELPLSSYQYESANRKRWSPADDAKLLDIVKEHGPKDWNFVASFFPERNADNVRLRYKYFLQFPENVRDKPFTPEEDAMIMAESQSGRRWARIGRITSRSSSAIKNRYYVLQRLSVRHVYEQKHREEMEARGKFGPGPSS
mmetsp:Transcript_6000/g.10802  ORF Transcript_6000/g.10802 Transcript_6000/m.10802 type:complete len:491 (+) Transcript_6000:584-2056(+)